MRLTPDSLIKRRLLGATAVAMCTGANRPPSDKQQPSPSKPVRPADWQTLPPTPTLPEAAERGMVSVEGGKVFFARFGSGPPVLLLHGGLANSDYWGHQVRALLATHTVVVVDTRGHGRSPLIPGRMDYGLFARDALAVLASLHIDRAAIVGWSDGANTGLELAIRAPDRLTGLFAFAANCSPSGTVPDGANSPVFRSFRNRTEREYAALAPRPADWPRLVDALQLMWRTEPHIGVAELTGIRLSVAIADGEHDEIIREQHTHYIARSIPGAKLVLLPDASHFAMLQQPDRFNAELNSFLA